MEIQILKVKHIQRIHRKNDKVKVYVDGDDHKHKFHNVEPGEYALVKIESLNDRIAVEEFIKNK